MRKKREWKVHGFVLSSWEESLSLYMYALQRKIKQDRGSYSVYFIFMFACLKKD